MSRTNLNPINHPALAADPAAITPRAGDVYYNTSSGLRVYNGSAWVAAENTVPVYVQKTNPGMTTPGLWIELNTDFTVKTFWVEDGQ